MADDTGRFMDKGFESAGTGGRFQRAVQQGGAEACGKHAVRHVVFCGGAVVRRPGTAVGNRTFCVTAFDLWGKGFFIAGFVLNRTKIAELVFCRGEYMDKNLNCKKRPAVSVRPAACAGKVFRLSFPGRGIKRSGAFTGAAPHAAGVENTDPPEIQNLYP